MSAFLVSVVVLFVVAAVIRMSLDEPDQVATSEPAPKRAKRARRRLTPRLPSSVSLLLLSVALGAFVAMVVVASVLVLLWTWRVSGP